MDKYAKRGVDMYKKVDTSLNFVEREKEIIAFWKENEVFEKSIEKNAEGEEFSFSTDRPRRTASRISGIS